MIQVRPQSDTGEIIASGIIMGITFWVMLALGVLVGLVVWFIGISILRICGRSIFGIGFGFSALLAEFPVVAIALALSVAAAIGVGVWVSIFAPTLAGIAAHPHDIAWADALPFASWTVGLIAAGAVVFFAYCVSLGDEATSKQTGVAFCLIVLAVTFAWCNTAYSHMANAYKVSTYSRSGPVKYVVDSWQAVDTRNADIRRRGVQRAISNGILPPGTKAW